MYQKGVLRKHTIDTYWNLLLVFSSLGAFSVEPGQSLEVKQETPCVIAPSPDYLIYTISNVLERWKP